MIDLPITTKVHTIIPKNAFYDNLNLNSKLKASFITDINHIYLEHSLTKKSLNLSPNSEGNEILVLLIELKTKEFNSKILEEISRQNKHNIIFYLANNDQCQLAVYKGKLYKSEWLNEEDLILSAQGLSLTEVWEGMISDIALSGQIQDKSENLTIDEQLKLQDQIINLEKQIMRKEKAVWREKQPKKKFKLNTELKELKRELERITNGKT